MQEGVSFLTCLITLGRTLNANLLVTLRVDIDLLVSQVDQTTLTFNTHIEVLYFYHLFIRISSLIANHGKYDTIRMTVYTHKKRFNSCTIALLLVYKYRRYLLFFINIQCM